MSPQAKMSKWMQEIQARLTGRSLVKFIYINLVEIEWIFGLFAAYWMGAGSIGLVILFVAISLVLGYGTSLLYWKLIDSLGNTSKRRRKRAKSELRITSFEGDKGANV